MTIHPLFERARQLGNPVIEGTTATFLWAGRTAPAFVSDLHDWDENPQPMTRLAPSLWFLALELPIDAYLEYSFYDLETRQRVADPLNPHRYWNGIHAYNHYFYMPQAAPTPLAQRKTGVSHGTLTRHQVEAPLKIVGKKRDVYLYKPPAEKAVPLLVVYDGVDYIRRGKIVNIVDNLIAQKRIRPIAMALVQNAREARQVEYACADSTLAFLTDTILPLAGEYLNLVNIKKKSGSYGIMGASMGGLMSLYTTLRLPKIFGKALCQAGAYEFWDTEGVVVDLVRYLPLPPVKLWLDCGSMDFLIDANHKMQSLLKEKGYDMVYFENNGAHNYATWRDCLWRGLEYLFG